MINVVIPMAGRGSRFVKEGFKKPKPFIDVAGKPMIQRVLDNLHIENAHYFLIAQNDHLKAEVELVDYLRNSYPVTFLGIDGVTEGTASTVLFARNSLDLELPLVIANADQVVDFSFGDFITDAVERDLDGSILTFRDQERCPKWSFVKLNNGSVVEVREKVPISEIATVGIYFFAKAKYFLDAAIQMIIENERVNGEFYTCPVYNYLIKDRFEIGVYETEYEAMHGLGTPQDLMRFLSLCE